MSPVQLAAALAAVVLVASVVSVELGVSVALLELTLGVVAGNAFHLHTQDWFDFVAKFASIVPHVPRRDGSRSELHAAASRGVARDRRRLVRRPVRRRLARRVLRARLEHACFLDHGDRAVDDVARGGLRRARRARADGHRRGQAPHERDFRHRPLHGAGTLGDLHQAEPLVSGLPGRLAGVDPRPAASRPVVLRPLRRPGDRAGDQARVRVPPPADGARGRVERARGPTGVRTRPGHEPPLRGAPRGTEAPARGRIRLPDAVLLPQGRTERLAGAVVRNLGLLAILLVGKMLPKLAFIYPLAHRADRRHGTFITLLMSTGLTFGTISSLYGLNAGIIDKTQFSLLVTVVVLSAVVPTAIAERWFLPDAERERRIDRRLAYAESEEFV